MPPIKNDIAKPLSRKNIIAMIVLACMALLCILLGQFIYMHLFGTINSNPQEVCIVVKNKYCLHLIYIPPGRFQMGKNYSILDYALGNFSSYNTPAFQVSIKKDYYIGKTSVNCGIFLDFLNSPDKEIIPCPYVNIDNDNKYKQFENVGEKFILLDNEKHAVSTVSWPGSMAFCTWLSKTTDLNFHLPTEAEWEYAARGSNNRYDKIVWKDFDRRHLSDENLPIFVMPNGIQDIEKANWVQDYFDFYTSSKKINPLGPDQPGKTLRNTYEYDVHVLRQPWIGALGRFHGFEANKNRNYSFRLCLDAEYIRNALTTADSLSKNTMVKVLLIPDSICPVCGCPCPCPTNDKRPESGGSDVETGGEMSGERDERIIEKEGERK